MLKCVDYKSKYGFYLLMSKITKKVVIIPMKETKELNYTERLKNIKRNKKFWSAWEVRERMLAKGLKKGTSIDNVFTVLTKGQTENIKIIEAAEEVIQIRQQVLLKDPIALKSETDIIAEYEAKKKAIQKTPLF